MHFVPIVQDGKTSVLIRAEGQLAQQPINRRSNVFLARSCLGQVQGGASFSQRSELATGRHLWQLGMGHPGAVQSKSVTSCAGMTAHFVLFAQTKVGLLSGRRSKRMKELPEKEVLARAAWSRYGDRLSQMWCRRLWCACQQPLC